jgi:phage shock protein A
MDGGMTMGLFKRFSNVVRSNLNDAISKAEDPRKLMDQALEDMAQEQKRAQQSRLEILGMVKHAEKQLGFHKARAAECERMASVAVEKGDDALARRALVEREQCEVLALECENSVSVQRESLGQLENTMAELNERVEEAKRMRSELMRRLSQAQIQRAVSQPVSLAAKDHLEDAASFNTFDRMVEKIEGTEAEVEAHRELAGGTTDTQEVELNRFRTERIADAALEELKRKMGKG